MRGVIGRVMGGKGRRLERKRSYNQQQYRKRLYGMAAKLHRRLHYTSRFSGTGPLIALMGKKRRIRGAAETPIVPYDARAPESGNEIFEVRRTNDA